MTDNIYNRHDRKKLNKCFRDIFNQVQRNYATLKKEAELDDDAKSMTDAFDTVKAIVNPSLDDKLHFLKQVAPEWNE